MRYEPIEGSCIYIENKFVYFSCTDKLYDKCVLFIRVVL